MATLQTLTYTGKATKQNHVVDGLIYLHHFGTGFQELVFTTHDAARRFAASVGADYRSPGSASVSTDADYDHDGTEDYNALARREQS